METNNPNMHTLQFNMPMVGAGSDAFWRDGYIYPADGTKPIPDTATIGRIEFGPSLMKEASSILDKAISAQKDWEKENPGTAIKFDQGKPPMHLLSNEALVEIAKVMQFGANKYDAHNWRKGFQWSRPLAAAMRHLGAFNDGEDKDPESGLSHLAHAACNLLFLIEFERYHPELDDRFKR